MGIVSTAELRSALRGLARNPVISISAIICLALGIGATTAIASAVSRALLDPLPLRDAGRLVAVHRVTPQSGPLGTWPHSVANYADLARDFQQVRELSALSRGTALVGLAEGGVQASQLYVTGSMFPMLGAAAERGRLIGPDDDRADAPLVAVLSDEFWRGHLGGDPAVVGRPLTIDGQPTTVIGILPPEFRIPHGGNVLSADIWMPIRFTPAQLSQRRSNYLLVLGRLAPGATVQAADAEARTLFDGIAAAHPELKGEQVRVAPLRAENLEAVRTPLLLLFAAVGMVLMIAATNVAALMLARGVHRRREIAVRTAIGATRRDAMRPALLESVIVAVAGAAIGIALALVGVRSIGALAAARMQQLAGLHLDARVLAFALVLTGVVALACGAVPAWRSARVDPQEALREGRGAGTGRAHHRALRSLVVAEIALSLVLVIGAGLVLKGFAGLLRMDPGFDPRPILTMRVTTTADRYAGQETVQGFLHPVLDAIAAIPGVEAAGTISAVPYDVWGNNSNIRYEGQPRGDPTRQPIVEQRAVTPGFWAVTGQRLVSGRLLTRADGAPVPEPAVVVNEALVRRDFDGRDAIGRRFYTSDSTFATIVGVVSDIRNAGPLGDPQPEMYWEYSTGAPGPSTFSLMIRVRGDDPAAVTGQVRAAIRQADPGAAIAAVRTMPEIVARSLGRPRFYFSLLGAFAAIALLLAVAGVYGTLSYAVAQRRHELGIRAALGSPRGALVRLVTGEGVRLVGIGIALGLLGGLAATRLITFMLYGVSPLDAESWIGAAVLMLVATMVATLVPALRAARADPMLAMRSEG